LKKLSIILTLSALLTSAAAAQAAPATPGKTARQETPPNVALTPEVMYKYLASELAFQRGEAFSAYATMLALARSTRDARLARRATEFAAAGSLSAEALKAARVWRELAPHSEEASQALLGLQIAGGRLDEAKQSLAQQLAAATPAALPGIIANIQRQLARVSDRARGMALMRELLEPYRDSVDAQLTLAQIAMVGGDRTTALREARAALDKHPTSELAALTLAQIVGDKDEAAKVLVDFLKKNPRAREVRLAYSRMLFEQNRLADAKREFQTLLQQYPQDQTALYAIGLLSAQANELDDADRYLASYIKSLNGQPDRERDATQALMVLAQIAEQRGDIPAALKWLEMVDGSGQGNYLGATMKRAQLTAQSGNLDAARALLQRADVDSEDERIKLIVSEAQLLRDAGCDGLPLAQWLRDKFFEQHIARFHKRPFLWHVWDGHKDGFSAILNVHTLTRAKLQTLIHTYLDDWITQQRRTVDAGGGQGGEALLKLAKAEALKVQLLAILEGEAPYDIFVRWKALDQQPIGWEPDLNDGVRLNIRPWLRVPDVGKKGAGVLRDRPNIQWEKGRGKDVVWAGWYGVFGGERINDWHVGVEEKRAARSAGAVPP